MSPLAYTSIETIPRALILVVGLLGLIFSIKGRSRGVSGLMVGAFVVMLLTTVAGIVWPFVVSNLPSWGEDLSADEIRLIFLGVGIPLDVATALSWLLVAITVIKAGRPARQSGPAPYSGPAAYPMAAQPGFQAPQTGYAQPAQPQSEPPAQQPPG
ncbi:hypothetical protein [Amycolatopsis pittospori]|uniref:hypothetical protein n=1 Tax=Amycolatopsis pittospori TaxID=2749434 RepID=UPI0015F04586|nr:hypothetical protein [Amycolatopsis pittospori]